MIISKPEKYVFDAQAFEDLRLENARLRDENAWLRSAYEDQQKINAQLAARIEELERRLKLNSSNSSKPPSSDGLKKPKAELRTKSLRGKSGNTSGGQKGHKGETLRQTAEPDEIEDHFPDTCGQCGSILLSTAAAGYTARQVFDLPEPQPLVAVEHRAHACLCGRCGEITKAAFPQGVAAPVQYGPRIASVATYLQCAHFLPEERLSKVMADLFNAPLATATLAAMVHKAAERFKTFSTHVCEQISQIASVKHLDETGFRVCGKTQWLHVACTPLLAFYRVSSKRGSLLTGLSGCIVHDHWKPYFTLDNVVHALCNAHHLRELQALIDIEKEDWSGQMQRLLHRAHHVAQAAQNQNIAVSDRLIALVGRRYDKIIAQALAFHEAQPALSRPKPGKRGRKKRRTGHNLALRLREHKEGTLRFLVDPDVPFTNNEAERDLRMMKLRQKISGGFRSQQGAEDFAILRSLITTARKQGWNIIETLMKTADQLIQDLKYA